MGKKINLYESLDQFDPNPEPDYLNLEEQQARINNADAAPAQAQAPAPAQAQALAPVPDSQTSKNDTDNGSDDQAPGIDTNDVIGSVALTAPEYDQKRQDQKLNQAKFSALGQAFGGLTDGMTLGLGGRVAKREKSKVSDYVDDFQKYNDNFQTKMEDYNYKEYLEKLRAGTAVQEQDNLEKEWKVKEAERLQEQENLKKERE